MCLLAGKHEEKIVLIIIIFVCGLLVGLFSSSGSEVLVKGIMTLSATFIGAFFAFKLSSFREQKNEIRANVISGNMAIFKLIRLYTSFTCYKNQFIEPHRGSILRHVEIRASIGSESWELNINYESLSYILESGNPTILSKISNLQDEVTSTIEMMSVRRAHHVDEVQPIFEESDINPKGEISRERLDELLGSRLTGTMISSTDSLVESVDDICRISQILIKEMYSINKNIYPNHKIVKMEINTD